MLYLLENTDKLTEAFISSALPYLSLQRLKKLDNLRMSSDKINCAAVYLMLRAGLKKEYGIAGAPEFIYAEHGKPSLADHADIHFSLSHCRNSCACIISDSETAVDINDIRRVKLRTAKYFCSQEEYAIAGALEDPSDMLIKLWSRKECMSKLDGRGLGADLRTFTDDNTQNVRTIGGSGYYCSYYSGSGELEPVILSVEGILAQI